MRRSSAASAGSLPNAALSFERYHLAPNPSANLSTAGRRERPRLLRPWAQLATGGALRRRADFQAFHDQHPSHAPEYLRSWCSGAKRCRLQPIKDFAALVERHGKRL